jgi:hypothetical protein
MYYEINNKVWKYCNFSNFQIGIVILCN